MNRLHELYHVNRRRDNANFALQPHLKIDKLIPLVAASRGALCKTGALFDGITRCDRDSGADGIVHRLLRDLPSCQIYSWFRMIGVAYAAEEDIHDCLSHDVSLKRSLA